MPRAVPRGRSFFGCGTTTVIVPLVNLWCDPRVFTSSKPSALRRLTMSRLLRSMRNYIHTRRRQDNPARARHTTGVDRRKFETTSKSAPPSFRVHDQMLRENRRSESPNRIRRIRTAAVKRGSGERVVPAARVSRPASGSHRSRWHLSGLLPRRESGHADSAAPCPPAGRSTSLRSDAWGRDGTVMRRVERVLAVCQYIVLTVVGKQLWWFS